MFSKKVSALQEIDVESIRYIILLLVGSMLPIVIASLVSILVGLLLVLFAIISARPVLGLLLRSVLPVILGLNLVALLVCSMEPMT